MKESPQCCSRLLHCSLWWSDLPLYENTKTPQSYFTKHTYHWPQVRKQGEFRDIQQFTSKLCSDGRRMLGSHEGCRICLGNICPESTTELLGSYSMDALWTSNTSAIRSGCLWDKSSSLFILFHLLKHIWIVQFYSGQGGALGQSHACYLHVFRCILVEKGILGRNS